MGPMQNTEIKQIKFDDLKCQDNFEDLVLEYSKESATGRSLRISLDDSQYNCLEKTGDFMLYGAFYDGLLIGFASVVFSLLPHYSRNFAVVESLFVAEEYRRRSSAGIMLVKELEKLAKKRRAYAILLNAPIDGKLEKLAMLFKYTATHISFFKKICKE